MIKNTIVALATIILSLALTQCVSKGMVVAALTKQGLVLSPFFETRLFFQATCKFSY